MENYDKLRQVIQEANPEIMKLKFGCEIDLIGMVGIDRIIYISKLEERYSACYKEDMAIHTFPDFGLVSDGKILGRPIRLADVLMAINKISIMQIGVFNDGTFLHKGDDMGWRWNLKDNNLENQSDETKQFLIDILVKTAKG